MNQKYILILTLIASTLYAKPTPEIVKETDIAPIITGWHLHNYLAGEPFRTVGDEPFADNKAGDLLFWLEYRGQPIAPGDLYIADYPTKKLYKQVRQAKTVTATTITTMTGTTIPLTNVTGIVKRVIRVTK